MLQSSAADSVFFAKPPRRGGSDWAAKLGKAGVNTTRFSLFCADFCAQFLARVLNKGGHLSKVVSETPLWLQKCSGRAPGAKINDFWSENGPPRGPPNQ